MEEFSLDIRLVHIGAVMASGALMLARGLAHNLWEAAWVKAWPLRYLSYTLDTILLTAALMLMTIVGQYPFVDSWLTIKVMLVIVYILLGYIALRGRSARTRWASLGGAALTYGFIISIARTHNPLGLFA
jgi:uncharacterized membrane protein SirB2